MKIDGLRSTLQQFSRTSIFPKKSSFLYFSLNKNVMPVEGSFCLDQLEDDQTVHNHVTHKRQSNVEEHRQNLNE